MGDGTELGTLASACRKLAFRGNATKHKTFSPDGESEASKLYRKDRA